MTQGAPADTGYRFSVIIPFHNAERTLATTLASLRKQSFIAWEAFLINDFSTDGSLEIAQQACARDARLHLIHDARQVAPRGAAATRNLGIAQSRGDFIAFLDADDMWLPEKLARQYEAFQEGADIVFSAYRRVDMAGREKGIVCVRPRVGWDDALSGNPIGCLTGAYRRARFPHARMPLDVWPEDYGFWLSLLRDNVTAVGLPEVLAQYRVSPHSVSANKLRSALGVWHLLGQQNISTSRQVCGFIGYIRSSILRNLTLQ